MKFYKKLFSINLNGHQFFALFAAYFVLLGFFSIVLVMTGFFYALILEIYLILGAAALIVLYFKNLKTLKFEKGFYFILAISILAVVLFSYYSNPTIFSGRDQGSLSEAAIRLSRNHKLEFSFPASKEFFNIYSQGKALNFPGFSYTADGNLITRFPLGYVAWLASFFSIFGLKGLIAANSVSFFVFLLCFYFIAKNILPKTSVWPAFLLVLTSFVFSWFFKFTLSENLAMALLWFGALEFYIFSQNRKSFDLTLSFLSLGLLLFVRIEGLAFLFMALLVLFLRGRKEKKPFFEIIGKNNIILLSFIAFLFLVSVFINKAFYLGLAGDIFHSFFPSATGDSSGSFLAESFFSLKVLSAYAILNFIILGILGIIYLFKNKKYDKLFPFFIVLPSLIYLIDPHISNDHPWMLRRYIFSIIPLFILYSVLFLDKFLKKRYLFYIFITLLLVANSILTIFYITFRPNENLLPQIEKLSANFKNSDLVLVDREATGDAFAMMSGPLNFLYGKQAVYFFNPKDLEKINPNNFSNIYLIVPDKNMGFYESFGLLSRMILQKDYAIEIPSLNVIMDKNINFKTSVNLPERERLITYGKIYLLNKD